MQDHQKKWEEIIAGQKASNLTITEYCRQRKLNKSTFYKWIHRLSLPVEQKKEKEMINTMKYWQQQIENQKASNLGTTIFCRQNGISQTTFYRWKKKLEEEQKQKIRKPEKVQWIQTKVSRESPASRKEEIRILIGNYIVVIPNHFEEALLQKVCQTLVKLC